MRDHQGRRVSLIPPVRFPNLPLSSFSLLAILSNTLTWPVAGLVAQRPHDDRRRIFVSLDHPRAALDDRVEPLRVRGRHDGVVAQSRVEAVRLEVGLVDQVQPVARAEVVPVVVVGEEGEEKRGRRGKVSWSSSSSKSLLTHSLPPSRTASQNSMFRSASSPGTSSFGLSASFLITRNR